MSLNIKKIINEKMTENNLTIGDIEKRGNFTRGALWPLIKGESINPTLKTLLSLADVFKCSVADLIGEQPSNPESIIQKSRNTKLDAKLYLSCVLSCTKKVEERKLDFNYEKLVFIIDELYNFSLKKGLTEVDEVFAEFVFDRRHVLY